LQNRFTVKRLCKPFYVCKSLADAIGNAVFSGLKFIFNPSNSHFDVKRVSNPLYIKKGRFRLFPQIMFNAVFQNENCCFHPVDFPLYFMKE